MFPLGLGSIVHGEEEEDEEEALGLTTRPTVVA